MLSAALLLFANTLLFSLRLSARMIWEVTP